MTSPQQTSNNIPNPIVSQGQTYAGTVKFFNRDKGFGFIVPKDAPVAGDLFVHVSDLSGIPDQTLVMGDEVRFRIQASRGKNAGKMKAVDVELVS